MRAKSAGQTIRYDVGVGEDLPYYTESYDAVVCVDVLEHVIDLTEVLSEVARVLKPRRAPLFDTINRNPVSRFGTITVTENLLRLLPKGTHDPELFIKPRELMFALEKSGLVAGPTNGPGPRGINRRGDFVFGLSDAQRHLHGHRPQAKGTLMPEIALLVTAPLFGGTMLYAFGFAAFIFTAPLPATAGSLIRVRFRTSTALFSRRAFLPEV